MSWGKVKILFGPVDFPCLNCDQPVAISSQIKLYCSTACKDEAKFVRYFRSCNRDGRINQPDVKDALLIRMAHILSGGYKSKERTLHPSVRRAVIERDKGLCRKCNLLGIDIDHIDGCSNELENLQLLCKSCHNEKTKSKLVLLHPEDEEVGVESKAKKKSLLARVNSLIPQRGCDDDENWRTFNRQVISERRQSLFEARLKYASQIGGNKEMEEGSDITKKEEPTVEKDTITQELDKLGELRLQRDTLETEKQALIDQVITPEIQSLIDQIMLPVKAQIEGIEAEFVNRAERIEEEIDTLEARVKMHVVKYGSTVGGKYLQAVWNKGRVSWDTKSMEQYAKSHREILVFRKEGPPTVSFRKVQSQSDNSLNDKEHL